LDKLNEELFNKEKPEGTTNLAGALKEAFHEHHHKSKHGWKPTTILVITDGEPDSRPAVEQAIVDATKKMNNDDDLCVSFIQIGNDHSAEKFLEHLGKGVKGARFDIVDSMTCGEMEGMSFLDMVKHNCDHTHKWTS